MSRWKGPSFAVIGRDNPRRQATCLANSVTQCFRSPDASAMSIQQKPDSFCSSNDAASACVLDELGNRWNRNVFPTGHFIPFLHSGGSSTSTAW